MIRTLRPVALLAALAVATVLPSAAHTPSPLPPDTRERLVVPAPARTRILVEMRAMLEALDGVLAALARGDRAAAAAPARGAGVATAVDAQPRMLHLLPATFVEAGIETHRAFDRLAAGLEGSGDGHAALAELASLTSRCVACHAADRLDEAR